MDEFKKGDRVCCPWYHGMIMFGNVESVDHNGERLLIRGDDMQLYETWKKELVVKLDRGY